MLTSKGQLTLPKPIRDLLRVRPGDAVDFVVDDQGEVRVKAGRFQASDLRGLLRRSGRTPVSLEAMDEAIRIGRARQAPKP